MTNYPGIPSSVLRHPHLVQALHNELRGRQACAECDTADVVRKYVRLAESADAANRQVEISNGRIKQHLPGID